MKLNCLIVIASAISTSLAMAQPDSKAVKKLEKEAVTERNASRKEGESKFARPDPSGKSSKDDRDRKRAEGFPSDGGRPQAGEGLPLNPSPRPRPMLP